MIMIDRLAVLRLLGNSVGENLEIIVKSGTDVVQAPLGGRTVRDISNTDINVSSHNMRKMEKATY